MVLIQDSQVKCFELGSETPDDFETLETRIRQASSSWCSNTALAGRRKNLFLGEKCF